MRNTIFLLLVILIAGCTKEVNHTSVQTATDVQNSSAAEDTYLPLTTNGVWKYENQTDSKKPENSKLIVLDKIKTINGKSYTAVRTVKDKSKDTIYYNQTGHNYYLYTNESTADANAVKLEILFLKDNVSEGTSWTQSAGSADGTILNCYGKIIEKNINITVNGITYKDVIHSYIEIRKPIFIFNIVVYKQDYYVAKNIGIVRNISEQILPSGSTTKTNIISYKVK